MKTDQPRHTCRHVLTFPVPCPGCNLPGAPYRPSDCSLCGGDAELEQCHNCAVWVEEVSAA
jgi:RecJ-like exonuclease